jgi:hypothetical protein
MIRPSSRITRPSCQSSSIDGRVATGTGRAEAGWASPWGRFAGQTTYACTPMPPAGRLRPAGMLRVLAALKDVSLRPQNSSWRLPRRSNGRRTLRTAIPDVRISAGELPELAGLRPSSLAASCLIGDARRSTGSSHSGGSKHPLEIAPTNLVNSYRDVGEAPPAEPASLLTVNPSDREHGSRRRVRVRGLRPGNKRPIRRSSQSLPPSSERPHGGTPSCLP